MIIQHNMQSFFSARQLNITTKKNEKTLEKLSSGYRINRAGDDAARLAISEKMRGQIRGLDRASKNSEDAISLIQVADGAMQEVDNMLNRMRTLAVQAANDTNTDDDREKLNLEVETLKQEINHIGRDTEFNTLKILQGKTLSNKTSSHLLVKFSVDPHFDDTPVYKGGFASSIGSSKTLDFSNVNNTNKYFLDGTGFSFRCTQNCDQVFEFEFVGSVENPTNGNSYGILDTTPQANINSGGSRNSKKFQVGLDSFNTGFELTSNIMNFVIEMNNTKNNTSTESLQSHQVGHANYLFQDGSKLILGGESQAATSDQYDFFTPLDLANLVDKVNLDIWIQSGANSGQGITIALPQIDTRTLGVEYVSVNTHYSASQTIPAVDAAVNYVNGERARLGAYQNRLEHTIANLDNSSENLQASESQIRDTDVAEAMMELSKENILAQAGTSMLSNTNSSQDMVLQLLQQ